MIRKSRDIPNEKTQLATCLLPINTYKMSTTTALKTHTAALAPAFATSGCSGGGGGSFSRRKMNTAATAMSALAANICKTATATKQMTPPMEAAVVVNSIIYSKPSFCSIVVDIGGKDKPAASKAPDTVNDNDKTTSTRINKTSATPTLSLPTPSHGGFVPLPATANRDDGHVYMMSTTMNGSIHHHISEMCDNLIAMGLFGMVANSEHDDDSFIEFAYDDTDDEDDIEFLRTDDDYKGHDEFYHSDEEDDDEDDEDEDDDDEDDDNSDVDNNIIEDYETEDDEDAFLNAGEDVTDFSKCPAITRAPLYNCDKKKKVRPKT